MSKRALDGFLACVIACAACNGDSSSGNGSQTNPFSGNWACSDETVITFTSPAGLPMQTTTGSTTLTITAAGSVLTASKASDAGSNCTVSFTSNGSTATLNDGQTCTSPQGFTLTYKSGSSTVNGSALNSNLSFEASGTFMGVSAMATGTQTSTCSRLSPPPTGGGTTTGGW